MARDIKGEGIVSGPPDYKISALNKDTREKGEIGAGWMNPDGSISISFNPFVIVPVGKAFALRLFPTTRPEAAPNPVPPSLRVVEDEELPFPNP